MSDQNNPEASIWSRVAYLLKAAMFPDYIVLPAGEYDDLSAVMDGQVRMYGLPCERGDSLYIVGKPACNHHPKGAAV